MNTYLCLFSYITIFVAESDILSEPIYIVGSNIGYMKIDIIYIHIYMNRINWIQFILKHLLFY